MSSIDQDRRWIRLGRIFVALNAIGSLFCGLISLQMVVLPYFGLKWLPSHLPAYLWRLCAWFSSVAVFSLRMSPNEFSMEESWCGFIMSLGVTLAFLWESISVPYMIEWDNWREYFYAVMGLVLFHSIYAAWTRAIFIHYFWFRFYPPELQNSLQIGGDQKKLNFDEEEAPLVLHYRHYNIALSWLNRVIFIGGVLAYQIDSTFIPLELVRIAIPIILIVEVMSSIGIRLCKNLNQPSFWFSLLYLLSFLLARPLFYIILTVQYCVPESEDDDCLALFGNGLFATIFNTFLSLFFYGYLAMTVLVFISWRSLSLKR